MKIVQINSTCGIGSTGKICVGISKLLTSKNIENYILYSSKSDGYKHGIVCSNEYYVKLQALKSRLLGNYGFNSRKATQRIINELERIDPDIVHIHNIHGHDCDLEMLFGYFKAKCTKLIWTFHDCWAFTGYCTHFTMEKCDKWETNCYDCPQRKDFSWFFDRSNELYCNKKELFSGLNLTIVTPSQWLADLVKQSFLKSYPVKVINNGIDLNVFKPSPSDFREKHGISTNQKLLLGVAFDWGKRKGLDVFIELAKHLTTEYKIVLVGTDDVTDKMLPKNIISIHHTHNQTELAEIYTAADVFINPTREDNFPTVNMESLACGTPVITFDTGGSPEIIDDTCGSVVECDNISILKEEIICVCMKKTYPKEACLDRAKAFDKNERFKEYLDLL